MSRTVLIASLLLIAACKASTPGARTPASGAGAGTAAAAAAPADPTPPPSATSDAELDQLMREIVAYVAALGDAAADAGGDCAKMAAAIERVAGEHGDLAARAARLDGDPTAEDRGEAWMKANEATTRPAFTRLSTAVERCKDDPGLQAAMAKIGSV